jgi:membrane associated rhomboid family serine protease
LLKRDALHVSHLLLAGVPRPSALELAIGAVVFVWGGALLGGLLPQEGISWQGHFLGAVGELVAAWVLARPRESAPAIL